MRAALEARAGTAEQLAALVVALLRAGGLEARSLRRAFRVDDIRLKIFVAQVHAGLHRNKLIGAPVGFRGLGKGI